MDSKYIREIIKNYNLQILDPYNKQGLEHIIISRSGQINRPINLLKTIHTVLIENDDNIIVPSRKGRVEFHAILNSKEQENFPYSAVRLVIGVEDLRIYSFTASKDKVVEKEKAKNHDEEWTQWNAENKIDESILLPNDENTLSSKEIQNIINGNFDVSILKKINKIFEDKTIGKAEKEILIKILKNEKLENGINFEIKDEQKGRLNMENGNEKEKTLTSEMIDGLSNKKGYKIIAQEEKELLDNLSQKGVVKEPEGKNGYKLASNVSIEKDESGKITITKMPEVNCCGIFFDEGIEKNLKEKAKFSEVPEHFHVTMRMTKDAMEVLENPYLKENLGKEVEVKSIASGNDGKNQGIAVEVEKEVLNGAWKEVIRENKETGEKVQRVPHITISMVEGAKAIDTGFIKFDQKVNQYSMKGKLGVLAKVGLSKKRVIITDIKEIENMEKYVAKYELDLNGNLKKINNKENEFEKQKIDTSKSFGELKESLTNRDKKIRER